MDFTFIKYSGQGSFKAKKGTIDKLILTEIHRHLPIASINDPLILDTKPHLRAGHARLDIHFTPRCTLSFISH